MLKLERIGDKPGIYRLRIDYELPMQTVMKVLALIEDTEENRLV